MNATGQASIGSVELLCSALRHRYAQLVLVAQEAIARLKRDESADDLIESMDELIRESAPDIRVLSELRGANEGGTIDETRAVLATGMAAIRGVQEEATRSIARISGQMDEAIQGGRGNRAYQTNNLALLEQR